MWMMPLHLHVNQKSDYDMMMIIFKTCLRLATHKESKLGKVAWKGLTSWLSYVVSTVSLSLFHWYPGSGVVLDCIDS